MRTRSILGLVSLVALLPTAGNGEEGAAMSVWRCESGEYQRQIALFQRDAAMPADSIGRSDTLACRVEYTKNGSAEELWQARNDPNFCQPRVLALIEKLENAGFDCRQTQQVKEGAAPQTGGKTVTAEKPLAPRDREHVPSNEDRSAVRTVLGAFYEESYLDAMVAAIPPRFSPLPDPGVLSTVADGVLHVGPPNHFVKTLPDGAYVLVNTLLLETGDASSFVSLGFLVREKRYSFLGFATAHSAVGTKVEDADSDQVSMMVSRAVPPSCDVQRLVQILRWAPALQLDDAAAPMHASGCND